MSTTNIQRRVDEMLIKAKCRTDSGYRIVAATFIVADCCRASYDFLRQMEDDTKLTSADKQAFVSLSGVGMGGRNAETYDTNYAEWPEDLRLAMFDAHAAGCAYVMFNLDPEME